MGEEAVDPRALHAVAADEALRGGALGGVGVEAVGPQARGPEGARRPHVRLLAPTLRSWGHFLVDSSLFFCQVGKKLLVVWCNYYNPLHYSLKH